MDSSGGRESDDVIKVHSFDGQIVWYDRNTSLFEVGNFLGSGAAGNVYECEHLRSREHFALKILNPVGYKLMSPALLRRCNIIIKGKVLPEEVERGKEVFTKDYIWWLVNASTKQYVAASYSEKQNNLRELSLTQCAQVWGSDPSSVGGDESGAKDVCIEVAQTPGGPRVYLPAVPPKFAEFVRRRRRIFREIKNMRKISSHTNVIRLEGVLELIQESKSTIFLVMELANGGELFDRIKLDCGTREDTAKFFFHQLLQGVWHCHNQGVCHRDLKPENLLLQDTTERGTVLKIADFGFSARFAMPNHDNASGAGGEHSEDKWRGNLVSLNSVVGSPFYVAPEVLQARGYDGPKADVWSLGVILYAMLAGNLPFEQELSTCKRFRLFCKWVREQTVKGVRFWDDPNVEYPQWLFPAKFSVLARGLIVAMLHPDPEKRITVPEAMRHPLCAYQSNSPTAGVTANISTTRPHMSINFMLTVAPVSVRVAVPFPQAAAVSVSSSNTITTGIAVTMDTNHVGSSVMESSAASSGSVGPVVPAAVTSSSSSSSSSSQNVVAVPIASVVVPVAMLPPVPVPVPAVPLVPVPVATAVAQPTHPPHSHLASIAAAQSVVAALGTSRAENKMSGGGGVAGGGAGSNSNRSPDRLTTTNVNNNVSTAAGSDCTPTRRTSFNAAYARSQAAAHHDTTTDDEEMMAVASQTGHDDRGDDEIFSMEEELDRHRSVTPARHHHHMVTDDDSDLNTTTTPSQRGEILPPVAPMLINSPSIDDLITADGDDHDDEYNYNGVNDPRARQRACFGGGGERITSHENIASLENNHPPSFSDLVKKSTRFITAVPAVEVLQKVEGILQQYRLERIQTPIGYIGRIELYWDSYRLEVWGADTTGPPACALQLYQIPSAIAATTAVASIPSSPLRTHSRSASVGSPPPIAYLPSTMQQQHMSPYVIQRGRISPTMAAAGSFDGYGRWSGKGLLDGAAVAAAAAGGGIGGICDSSMGGMPQQLFVVEFVRERLEIFAFKRFYEWVRQRLSQLVKRDYAFKTFDPASSPMVDSYLLQRLQQS